MGFGTLFTHAGDNPRTTALLAVAKANGLDLEVIHTRSGEKPSPEHKKANGLGKIPAFIGQDGFALSECMAIAIYFTSQNEKTTLLGKTKQDYASILQWMSFFTSEVLSQVGEASHVLLGLGPYNKKTVEEQLQGTQKAFGVVEEHLLHNTYLVGERITLADLFAAGIAARGFQYFFGKEWRSEHPHVTRWYETVCNQPIYTAIKPKVEFIDTPVLTNAPPKKAEHPKKEHAPKQEKKVEKKEATTAKDEKKDEDDEDDVPKEPKAKHPLDLLPRSTFVLDDLKRQYSNNDSSVALKWFWENCNFEEYSIWKVKYKYNDELTLTFMSNNLIGGFNNRLEASRKYIFGCMSVYGVNNDSVIEGAFVIRGQDYLAAFDVAPDWESYSFEKLDLQKPADKEYLEEQWSWEKPVVVAGKEYPHAVGKVFK